MPHFLSCMYKNRQSCPSLQSPGFFESLQPCLSLQISPRPFTGSICLHCTSAFSTTNRLRPLSNTRVSSTTIANSNRPCPLHLRKCVGNSYATTNNASIQRSMLSPDAHERESTQVLAGAWSLRTSTKTLAYATDADSVSSNGYENEIWRIV